MALKARVDELISDVKSSMPMFKLSPAKKVIKDGEKKKDEKMKTKILETWNNLRYDFSAGAYLKKDIPIWILGVCHSSKGDEDFVMEEMIIDDGDSENPELVTQLAKRVFTDFASRPWFTYRKHFPVIPGTNITSDTGWGCMLRSAQMMIAQGFFLHYLGRDWRWLQTEDPHRSRLHKKILGWFVDDPGEQCPLSIHHLSQIGRKFGIMPGNWYGPNTVAYIMQQALEASKEQVTGLGDVVVYVAQDCTVYSQDVYDLCGWTRESAFEPESAKNNAFSDSDYTESVSSECESSVYVDEIADEVSEITKFSAPEDVTLSDKNFNENMIPMREFVNSTDINPEVTIGEQWKKPKKKSPFLKKRVARNQMDQDLSNNKTDDYSSNLYRLKKMVAGNEPKGGDLAANKPNVNMTHCEPDKTDSDSGTAQQNALQPDPYKVNNESLLTKSNVGANTPYTSGYREHKRSNNEKLAPDAPKSSIRDMFENLLTKTSDSTGAKNECKTAKHGDKIPSSTLPESQPQTSTSISSMFSSTLNNVFSKLNSLQFDLSSEASENQANLSNSEQESKTEHVSGASSVFTKDIDRGNSELILDSSTESTHQEHKIVLEDASSALLNSEQISLLHTSEPQKNIAVGQGFEQTDEDITSSTTLRSANDSPLTQNAGQILKSYDSYSGPTHGDDTLLETSSENTIHERNENCITASNSDIPIVTCEENLLTNGPVNILDSSRNDNSIKNDKLDVVEIFNSSNAHSHDPKRISESFVSNCEEEQQKTLSAVENDPMKRDRAEYFMSYLDSYATGAVGLSEIESDVFAHSISHCDIDEDPSKILNAKDDDVSGIHIPNSSSSNSEPDSSRIPLLGQPETNFTHVPGSSPTLDQESPKRSRPASVIILIPVRLGESNLNPIYTSCIQEMLSLESSIGIIGGKPKHSLYFVGFQGEHLLHLDPHYCQTADTPSGYRKNLHNYHTMSIRKTNVKKIDPSCCFGFYCRNARQFEKFKQEGSNSSNSQSLGYPMCLILEGKSGDHHLNSPISRNPVEGTTHEIINHQNSVLSLPEDDHEMATRFENDVSLSKPPTNRSKSSKKSETKGFSVDEMGAKLNKLISDPSKFYPKFMRQKSSSPVRKKKLAKEESLESQFELL